jgi:hypothetical protein
MGDRDAASEPLQISDLTAAPPEEVVDVLFEVT